VDERNAYTAMQVTFYNILWDEVFFPLFKRLERPIPYQADLATIFESTESMDRYNELKSILVRAESKLAGDPPVVKNPKFSMNLISLALKAQKWRKMEEAKSDRNKYNKYNTVFSFEDTVLNSKTRSNRYWGDEPLIKNVNDQVLSEDSRFDAPTGSPFNTKEHPFDNKEYSRLLWEKIKNGDKK
jgi:hypothetical protein